MSFNKCLIVFFIPALTALIAMTVIFRKAMTKAMKSVGPERRRKESQSRWS